MTLAWAVTAAIIAAATFVQGLAGFGIGLVALAFLPFVMAPATAVVLMTVYALLFTVVIFVPLRRDVDVRALGDLLVGTVAGAPFGVAALAAFSPDVLKRLIGAVLIVVVVIEALGRYPRRIEGRAWALGAGALGGVLGGAIGTPAPPVILYAAAKGWHPRAAKANIQVFLLVNQAIILAGYWWADLLSAEVWRLTATFALPAIGGVAAGMALFSHVDQTTFRRIVFAVLLGPGVVLAAGA